MKRQPRNPGALLFLGCLFFILVIIVVYNWPAASDVADWLSQFLNVGR